jgi:hypothetical protein
MVEAVGTSETSVSTGLHGATSQKTFVFTRKTSPRNISTYQLSDYKLFKVGHEVAALHSDHEFKMAHTIILFSDVTGEADRTV